MTKTALIIGAQDYDPRDGLTPLSCARNDALALGRVLREQCGFGDVRVLAGEGIADSDGRPTKSAIRREINRLRESPKRIELLVVAFCAHGLTLPVGGADRYYLLPEDAHQHEPDSFLEFADLMRRLNEIPANDRAVIFDTCRNRPEAGRASGDNLLARDLSIELLTRPEDERKGTTAVLTACSLGERAYEMQDAGHGVFFHFLLQGMKGPAWTEQGTLSLNDAFGYAEREIAARKVFRQRPTFEQKGGGVILLGQREEPSADLAFWQRVQNSTVAADFEAYLREFPTGRFVLLARQRLDALRQAEPPVPTPQPPRKPPLPAIVLGVVALIAVAGFALTRDNSPAQPFRASPTTNNQQAATAAAHDCERLAQPLWPEERLGGVPGVSSSEFSVHLRAARAACDAAVAAYPNDPRFQAWLGVILYYQIGYRPETEAAFRFAAERGHRNAQVELARLLRHHNRAEASQWYRRAAEQGDIHAQYVSGGNLLIFGRDARDKAQGEQWLRRAADQGYVAAQLSLADDLLYGTSIARNEVEAEYWYRRAVEQAKPGPELSAAEFLLANFLVYGPDTSRNLEEGVTFYQRAARSGHITAREHLRGLNRTW